MEHDNSDIDVVVEYEGEIREDVLFNYLHEEDFSLCGLNVDINPITEAKTGTLETYLPSAEKYRSEKAKQQNMEITFYVAECNEFPSLGEYHDKIGTVDEALKIYESIPTERMNPTEKLVRDIDQFSKDYDPHDYADRVEDSIENQTSIRESIEAGEKGYLKDWLDTITIEDDYIDNRRHAHQLLQRLEQVAKTQEYKPLAKVEEIEEGKYI